MDAIYEPIPLSVLDIVNEVAPRRFRRDPFGLFSGYRAFLVYVHFSVMDDRQLASIGVNRQDIPRIAGRVVLDAVDSRTARS